MTERFALCFTPHLVYCLPLRGHSDLSHRRPSGAKGQRGRPGTPGPGGGRREGRLEASEGPGGGRRGGRGEADGPRGDAIVSLGLLGGPGAVGDKQRG